LEPGPRILLVDRKPAMRRPLRDALRAAGYSVFEAATASAALAGASAFRPDVTVLSMRLPDGGGVALITRLREFVKRPIIVISAQDDEDELISALDAGADDYLTRPFGTGELLARLRVMLRHVAGIETGDSFQTGELEVDLSRRQVTMRGQPVQLTPTEYDLLKALATAVGKVLTQRQLLRQVWG
jgi:two-component system KDP operon response regulator KdpE